MQKAICINPYGLVEGEDFGHNTVKGETYDLEFAFTDLDGDTYYDVYKEGKFLERSKVDRFEFQ